MLKKAYLLATTNNAENTNPAQTRDLILDLVTHVIQTNIVPDTTDIFIIVEADVTDGLDVFKGIAVVVEHALGVESVQILSLPD